MLMCNDRLSLDIYDEFHLGYFAYEPVWKWMLVGLIKIKDSQVVTRYIAISDNEEELCVWADTHGIIVEKA